MWCPNCQADVSAEVSADNRFVHCSSCRAELSTIPEFSEKNSKQEARDLLLRWSNSSLIDPFGPDLSTRGKQSGNQRPEELLPPAGLNSLSALPASNLPGQEKQLAAPHSESIPPAKTDFLGAIDPLSAPIANIAPSTPSSELPTSAANGPILSAPNESPVAAYSAVPLSESNSLHDPLPGAAGGAEAAPFVDLEEGAGKRPDSSSIGHRIDSAHAPHSPMGQESSVAATPVSAPSTPSQVSAQQHHPESRNAQRSSTVERIDSVDPRSVDVQSQIVSPTPAKSNWQSPIGQVLAYLGIGLLTIGTILVIWSYFGGPSQYAPTGWFAMTIGQMLLFLGVVTLISGGMEQTTNEVNRRIESIGARLIRIEQHTRDQPVVPRPKYLDRMKDGQKKANERVS